MAAKPAKAKLWYFTGLTAILLSLALSDSLDRLDYAAADPLMRAHAASRKPPSDIVIVAIDQKSLEDLNLEAGSWPWPRAMHAELIDGLQAFGPRLIAFDLLFNESDAFRPDSDAAFRAIAQEHSNLYFASLLLPDGNQAPLAKLPTSFNAVASAQADEAASATLLMPLVLAPENWRGGLINFEADSDGIGRHARIRHRISGWSLPGFAAQIANDQQSGLPESDRIRLNWYGEAPQTISFSDLIEDLGKDSPKIAPGLKDKTVLVAATASGLNDFRPTPLGTQTLGGQILTTAIANLRQDDWIRDLPVRWPLLIGLPLIVLLIFHKQREPLRIGIILIALSLTLLGLSYYALRWNYFFGVGAALTLAWLSFGFLSIQAHLAERRERQATISLFSRFLDRRVVDDLISSGELSREQKPQSREVTVLFSDIRDFTRISESRSPEAVVELLNRYFTRQVEVIFKHGGTLDKFIGDAIMAFWNAPSTQVDHADRALMAALDMLEVLKSFRCELAEIDPSLNDFDIGIGIHSGPAVVGFLGSDSRIEYTVIGDSVNLGSRIEGATKGVCRLLISQATLSACRNPEYIAFTPMGRFDIKGRIEPVDLFEVTLSQQTQGTDHG